jgi:hypothetical protein
VWVFLYLLKSAIDFVFQGPHRRTVAGDMRKG